MIKIGLLILRLLSSLFLLAFVSYLYGIFHAYDWGHPLVKLGCFTAFFVAILVFYYLNLHKEAPSWALWIEMGVLSIIFVTVFFRYGSEYGQNALQPPYVDVGYTTANATILLVKQQQNPYSSHYINPRDELALEYRGFHYGPLMMLAYLPGAYFPERGFKFASLLYILISAILLGFLVVESGQAWAARLASIAFVETAFFLPERFWYEALRQGANDVFPVMLLLAALLALKKDRVLWTGLLVGLSFAAKFSPAIFLMPFLPFRQKKFWLGLTLGLAPLLPFLVWDPAGLFNNVFWVRFVLRWDSTSLYSVLPASLHWLMPTCLLAAVVFSVYRNYRRPPEFRTALFGFALLLIVAEVTFKEIHGNHLLWFFPIFAVIFTLSRERLFGLVSAPIGEAGI